MLDFQIDLVHVLLPLQSSISCEGAGRPSSSHPHPPDLSLDRDRRPVGLREPGEPFEDLLRLLAAGEARGAAAVDGEAEAEGDRVEVDRGQPVALPGEAGDDALPEALPRPESGA